MRRGCAYGLMVDAMELLPLLDYIDELEQQRTALTAECELGVRRRADHLAHIAELKEALSEYETCGVR